MNKHVVRSLEAGGIAAVTFFVLTLMSLFMVGGNGTAPAFTYAMLWLNEIPFRLFGAKISDSMILVSTSFWSFITAAIVFVYSLLFDSSKSN
jgi:hypothetical protein